MPLGEDRPYLERTDPLPRQLDDVTPAWLTEVLANRYPGIVVRDIERIETDNTHTTKVRLRWDLNDVGRSAGIPETVCLKANWSGLRTGDICELEARFYQELGARLDGLVPATFFADWDDNRGGNGVVVMEDLGTTPGVFGSSDDHPGVDGVAAGLEALAKIHAAHWDDPWLESWDWLRRSMDTPNDADQVILYWNYIRYNLADPAYAAFVPAWVHESPERLGHALDELSAYEREHGGPRCIVHGDADQGNSFRRADGRLLWLDWQLVRKGRPLRDVEYYLVSSLEVDDRRAAARDLVEHYRQALVSAGAELGAEPRRGLGAVHALAGVRDRVLARQRQPVGPTQWRRDGRAPLRRRRGLRDLRATAPRSATASPVRTRGRRVPTPARPPTRARDSSRSERSVDDPRTDRGGGGHRAAAVEDTRPLPLVETPPP